MIYFDTNVLIYNSIEQDLNKSMLSEKFIKHAIKTNTFVISPLVLSEFIFVLSKQKIIDKCKDDVKLYSHFCKFSINRLDIINAYKKCKKLNKCRNINDFIHLEIANKYCDKIVTFDSDFKNLQGSYDIEIEILGGGYEME